MGKNTLKIGNEELPNPYILAPLAGLTDMAFRQLCSEQGAGMTVTEMVSAKGLVMGNRKTAEMLTRTTGGSVSCVQLFGSDPVVMAEAAAHPLVASYNIIDINMGCPVSKVVSCGEGAKLMQDVKIASSIVASMSRVSTLPVTVKIRLGWDEGNINCVEFAKMLADSGAKAITLHARTREQFYSGLANWDYIGELSSRLTIPVIGNGDAGDNATQLMDKYHCSGIMIGRNALGDSGIFARLCGALPPSRYELLTRHIEYARKLYADQTVPFLRTHLAHYIKGCKNARDLRGKINSLTTIEQVLALLHSALNG